ncbi:Capsule biosynthesis protein CapA [Pelotomaculum sp. FP]|nr:Capsule biosynthesis protein CapA [Pelotomaculum sp. FP]
MLLYFKRVLLLLLIIIFLLIMLSIVFPIDSSSSSISNLEVSSRPFLALDTVEVDGRMLVPLEQISRPLDLSYAVNGETLLLSKAGTSFELTAGSRAVWSAGKVFCLDVPPQILNGKLYVPLRFICESFGAGVIYNNGAVDIEYPADRGNDLALNFAGDTTLAWSFEDAAGDDLTYAFADAGWFGEADVTMVNLENAVTDRGYKAPKQFNFRMPPKYTQALLNGGIDIVNLANNHVWDYGAVGLQDTIAYLDAAGIEHVGAGESIDAAAEPAIIEVKGKRIGFLGFYFNEGNVEEGVAALKQKADVVVVNFHWGTERSNYPDDYQVDLAHRAIDAGADLVIGHHPHVLQGMERYKGGVIAYSLGNFIFGGNSRRQHDTVVFQLIIRGREKIPAIIPVRISDWQPYRLAGEEGRQVVDSIREYSSGFAEPLL